MKARVLPGDDPHHGQLVDYFKFLQIGTIVRVDDELNLVDISFDSNPSIIPNIPLTSPFFTGRAFIGGMPEVGTMVVCGFIKNTNSFGSPIILTYLNPFYIRSLNYAYDDGKAPIDLDSLASVKDKIGYGVTRLKRRKIYPGDINLESSQGAEMLLNDDVSIADANLNEIMISSVENAIISSSINNVMYTSGVRVTSGTANRPGAVSVDKTVLPNGKSQSIITDNTNSIDLGGQPFSEFRIDVNELSTGVMPPVDSFEQSDFDITSPDGSFLVSQTFGTLIGNSKRDIEHYGRVLRPQIFTSAIDSTLDIRDVNCVPNEYLTISGAYQLKFKSGTKIDVDKEGHTFIRIAASTGRHPLGAGRSLEMATDGSLKAFIGRNINQQHSIDLETSGACSFHFGSDDRDSKSLDWVLERSMYISVKASDRFGFALNESYIGNVTQKVVGNKEITVSGNYTITVQGKIQENILGMKVENFVNDKLTNYGGNYGEIIVKSKTSKIGGVIDGVAESTDIAVGDSTLKIKTKGDRIEEYSLGKKSVKLLLGDSIETLIKGDRKTDVTLGSIKETIGVGDKTTSITTGDFKVSITAGKIEISTGAGSIKISTAGATIDITSTAVINVKAPIVNLGPGVLPGMVVTNVTHPVDYITGLPIIGTPTVNAG